MPKVIYTRPVVGTLDSMEWEQLEATEEHEHRFLSPELTDEQVAHYLSIPAFHAQTVEPKAPEAPKPPASPEIKPEVKQDVKPEGSAAGSDGKIQKGAGAKKPAAKPQSPKRETPAERKARLAAESQKGAE